MELKGIYTQLALLFLLIFFGYILGKIKVITASGIEAFSKFIVKVALPAVILSGMIIPLTSEKLHKAVIILLLSAVTYGLAYLIAIVFSRLFVKPKDERGIYSFALVFSNSAFMGYPVLQAMFGKEAIFYAAIYNMTFSFLLYTLGIKLLDKGKNENDKFYFKLLKNPGILASIFGLIIFVTGFPMPKFLVGGIDAVAGLCTPLSMITIGAMLSGEPIKSLFNNRRNYELTVVRLIILPVLTFILLKYLLRIEDIWLLGIPVIVAGMPVASNAAMMAAEYDNHPEIASQVVFISTLFSCITIPLLTYLL